MKPVIKCQEALKLIHLAFSSKVGDNFQSGFKGFLDRIIAEGKNSEIIFESKDIERVEFFSGNRFPLDSEISKRIINFLRNFTFNLVSAECRKIENLELQVIHLNFLKKIWKIWEKKNLKYWILNLNLFLNCVSMIFKRLCFILFLLIFIKFSTIRFWFQFISLQRPPYVPRFQIPQK